MIRNLLTMTVLLPILFLGVSSAHAYRQPISTNFMPPYCPLRSDGSKDNSCLYIPKSQCNYFVSKQGNNTNPGTEVQPFATIQHGVDQLSAGEALCIKGYSDGTKYNEAVTISKNGTGSNWITIGGYEPDTQVINQGSGRNGVGFKINQASHIRLIGITATQFEAGTSVNDSDNIDVINVKAFTNWNEGINVPSSDGTSS